MSILLRILKSVPISILLTRLVKLIFTFKSERYSQTEFRKILGNHKFLPILSSIKYLELIESNANSFEFFGISHKLFKTKEKVSLLKVHNDFYMDISKNITGDYTRFDWQLDAKNSFRFDERKQYNKQNSNSTSVDIKVPWELGRLQHLPPIAFEILAIRNEKTIIDYKNQVLDFIASNPIGMGVQWACSMDVGIRVSNLLLSYDLLYELLKDDKEFNQIFLNSIYAHAKFIFNHLEYKEGLTGNHYLFNLMGLLFASTYLEKTKEIKQWNDFAIAEIEKEMFKQFFEDGGNFEGSTAYHCLSAEMMVYATALMLRQGFNPSNRYINRLYRAGKFVADMRKPNGEIPQFGDNDSGRLFKISNNKSLNYTNVLAAFNGLFDASCFKKYGKEYPIEKQMIQQLSGEYFLPIPKITQKEIKSILFNKMKYQKETITPFSNEVTLKEIKIFYYPDFGLHIFKSEQFYLTVSTIANKDMHHSWGHVHNDKLSFELQVYGKDMVKDPGSYCYTSDIELRNQFRSTAAHHSIIIDGVEQNNWIEDNNWGLFYLDREVKCRVLEITDNGITIEANYYGVCHIRSFKINENELVINDYCNKPFEVNINKFPKYSIGYGILIEKA